MERINRREFFRYHVHPLITAVGTATAVVAAKNLARTAREDGAEEINFLEQELKETCRSFVGYKYIKCIENEMEKSKSMRALGDHEQRVVVNSVVFVAGVATAASLIPEAFEAKLIE